MQMDTQPRPGRNARRDFALWAEFLAIYAAAPVAMSVLLPAGRVITTLTIVTAFAVLLLHRTEGFRWRSLMEGIDRVSPAIVVGFAAVTCLVSFAIMRAWNPESLFSLPRERPYLMFAIALLYPVFSVLPQELVYRPLYFVRYGRLLPGGAPGLALNAALFSLGHLMYWSWVVAAMTFVGGLAFAWAYETRRSFPLAFALHWVAGVAIFTFGMGQYFYSGNVVRPF